MPTFVTTRCRASGHPEFTLQFREARPVPVERMLLNYLEGAVAARKHFAPGQTMQIGWATLRLCARSDGTLGVEERDGDGWVESCNRSLMQTWLQKEVAASVGLLERLAFPRQDQGGAVCSRALSGHRWHLVRVEPDAPTESGWGILCEGQGHDHSGEDEVRGFELFAITERLPFAAQFLALPVGATVLVDGTQEYIRAHVTLDAKVLAPARGSYLASLNERRPT
jgi:hypothetical protein